VRSELEEAQQANSNQVQGENQGEA